MVIIKSAWSGPMVLWILLHTKYMHSQYLPDLIQSNLSFLEKNIEMAQNAHKKSTRYIIIMIFPPCKKKLHQTCSSYLQKMCLRNYSKRRENDYLWKLKYQYRQQNSKGPHDCCVGGDDLVRQRSFYSERRKMGGTKKPRSFILDSAKHAKKILFCDPVLG